ncbi:MAG: hypothetical protein IKU12_02145 [Oscillospiraceae bacterium]|nr:hypothetical protein [Oscillospiraceae bacterium]
MAKRKSFADDGWAIWVTGEDVSTFYLNEWVNPQGKSYVDVAVRIRGVKGTHDLNIYIPFHVGKEEIEDLSHHLKNENVFRAIFSTRCILDYMKNRCTSEIAYHGKTVDLVHISRLDHTVKPLAGGTLMTVSIDALMEYLDNDEAYFMFRLPHKNLDEIFKPQIDVQNAVTRLRDLLTSPVVSEKYACSVRVNEARLLPDEINQIGAFHRQKLNKVVVTLSLQEDYQVNDSNCYRIHRLEKDLYGDYMPKGCGRGEMITYEWNESREKNLYGHFNFYFGISRDSISKSSMLLYLILLFVVSLLGNMLWELLAPLLGL